MHVHVTTELQKALSVSERIEGTNTQKHNYSCRLNLWIKQEVIGKLENTLS